eukprot:9562893-Lingulodinium_polyedra.AAC.1
MTASAGGPQPICQSGADASAEQAESPRWGRRWHAPGVTGLQSLAAPIDLWKAMHLTQHLLPDWLYPLPGATDQPVVLVPALHLAFN